MNTFADMTHIDAPTLLCSRQKLLWSRGYCRLLWYSLRDCHWPYMSAMGLTISSYSRRWRKWFARHYFDWSLKLLPYSRWRLALVLHNWPGRTIWILQTADIGCCEHCQYHRLIPDSKVHGANRGPIWDRQVPGGPHVGPMNFAVLDVCNNV